MLPTRRLGRNKKDSPQRAEQHRAAATADPQKLQGRGTEGHPGPQTVREQSQRYRLLRARAGLHRHQEALQAYEEGAHHARQEQRSPQEAGTYPLTQILWNVQAFTVLMKEKSPEIKDAVALFEDVLLALARV